MDYLDPNGNLWKVPWLWSQMRPQERFAEKVVFMDGDFMSEQWVARHIPIEEIFKHEWENQIRLEMEEPWW